MINASMLNIAPANRHDLRSGPSVPSEPFLKNAGSTKKCITGLKIGDCRGQVQSQYYLIATPERGEKAKNRLAMG
jgi:hypothetical protein